MEDLIQNAHTLFDEGPSPTQLPPVHSPDVVETTSTETYSSWYLSPDSKLPRSAEMQATGYTSRRRSGLVDGITASSNSSSSLFPSDDAVGNRFTPPRNALLSPLRGLPSTNRPTEGVVTKSPLPQSEAPTIPQSPPESIPLSTSDFPLSSATSLQTTMWSP